MKKLLASVMTAGIVVAGLAAPASAAPIPASQWDHTLKGIEQGSTKQMEKQKDPCGFASTHLVMGLGMKKKDKNNAPVYIDTIEKLDAEKIEILWDKSHLGDPALLPDGQAHKDVFKDLPANQREVLAKYYAAAGAKYALTCQKNEAGVMELKNYMNSISTYPMDKDKDTDKKNDMNKKNDMGANSGSSFFDMFTALSSE
ncbi:hypothetical protein ACFSSC_02170 [Corynebacterium mendelii]|uniref:Uncharacterized protein n=1 Tax=Corynebacterium mendelii TaxID=2765362 RepID=A0A939E1I1_9CORY|nr:hypothetical protein [Corynebacterium mendelii]MBN9644088.1 hypothetical protein [Corynebacterium mendelii]